jgi:MtN3 and saliva related transmembrane protein
MSIQNLGMHHLHKRKRVYKKLEKYPHPHKFKRFFDKFIYFIAIGGSLLTIPQVLKIYINHDASSISSTSWIGYLFLAIAWLIYGILHKEKPIIISNILLFILNLFVVIGTILY